MNQEPAMNIHSFPCFAKGKRSPSNRLSVPFGKFITTLPTTPLADLAPNLSYPMDLNDQIGCCVVAAWDHAYQVITNCLSGTGKNFTSEQIIDFYKTQNPNFDPNGTASTNGPGSSADGGMNIQEFLGYLQSKGYILGFAAVDHTNEQEVKAAIYIGLALMTGVILDDIQMQQFQTGVWNNVPGSSVDGGHGVPAVGFGGSPDDITFVSWAKLVNGTPSFISKQVDEMWFILTQAHVDHPNFRNHFDLAGFSQAVSQITGGKVIIPIMPTWKYFTETESTGGGHTVAQLNPALVNLLDTARGIAGIPFVISSGYRTSEENTAVGGVSNSAHLTGNAADIVCTDQTRWTVFQGIQEAGFKRIEIAPNHIHADICNDSTHPSPWLGVATQD